MSETRFDSEVVYGEMFVSLNDKRVCQECGQPRLFMTNWYWTGDGTSRFWRAVQYDCGGCKQRFILIR